MDKHLQMKEWILKRVNELEKETDSLGVGTPMFFIKMLFSSEKQRRDFTSRVDTMKGQATMLKEFAFKYTEIFSEKEKTTLEQRPELN